MENKQERKRESHVRTVLLVICSSLILIFVSTGCDEQPVSVGEGILPTEDFIRIDTLIVRAYESFSFEHPLVTSGSHNIFAGMTDELRVESIFRFAGRLSTRGIIPELIDTVEIFEATLFLKPSYYFGDTTETVSVYLHEVLSGWSTSGFNRDIYESIKRSSEPVSFGSIMLGDTNAIALPLPEELLHGWATKDTLSIIPQGFVIRSDASSNGIIGFNGTTGDDRPELQIIFGTQEDQDTVVISENFRAFAAFLKKDLDLQNNIILQAGVSTHAVVRFDLHELPKGAIIHNAELELTRNQELTPPHQSVSDSLFVYRLVDSNKLSMLQARHQTFTQTVVDTVTNIIRYRSRVSNIVQEWVTQEEDKGFILRDNHETLGFHRTSFYTEAAEDPDKRPRLKIIFSPM